MKIEISRSFSKKIQLRQYEPIEFFCAATKSVDEKDAERCSEELDALVQKEVEKSANKFKAPDIKKAHDIGLDDAEHDL